MTSIPSSARGDRGSRCAPTAARTLDLRSVASAVDRFWIAGDFPREIDRRDLPWAGLDVLEARPLADPPELPLLVWEDVIGPAEDAAALARSYLAGMVRARVPKPQTPREIDARSAPLLSDEEFWPVIDALDGSQAESTVNRVARRLADRDEAFLVSWEQTVGVKARPLLDAFDASGVLDTTALWFNWVVGSTIGRGRAVYEAVLADPTLWRSSWVKGGSSSILWLGSTALDRKFTRTVFITTTYTEYWRGPREEAQPRFEPSDLDRAAVRTEVGEVLTEAGLDVGILRHLDEDERDPRILFSGFGLVVHDGTLRMRIVVADADPSQPADALGEAIGEAIESFGGRLFGEVQTNELHWAGLFSDEVFALRRRFAGNREEFVARFAPEAER